VTYPPEPTSEQCSSHSLIEHGARRLYACFYPQMGGYHGKCLVEPKGGCFDVYVWHDGEFPFGTAAGSPERPAHLHHCAAEQFIEFGQFVAGLPGMGEGETEP
jgi:hypothetical protein